MPLSHRHLPAVHKLAADPGLASWAESVRIHAARSVTNELRLAISAGELDVLPDVVTLVALRCDTLERGSVRRAINATGVVVHTNLGRATWSPSARAAAADAMGACTVEFDRASGARGDRLDGVRAQLRVLTGAADAVVVNNCAAAVLLALTALCADQDVVVSRGELVEIGGSFRVPEVIAAGGARLVEVGATNRTRVADFERATNETTAAWLRVHPSNFWMEGFVEAPDTHELAMASEAMGVPLFVDLGSGAMEPMAGARPVRDVVARGAALTMFSGDKLLGGPQAGIVVGDTALVSRLRRHPLYRAMRLDKVSVAALEATLGDHLAGRGGSTGHTAYAPLEVVHARAEYLSSLLSLPHSVMEVEGRVGGGSAPAERLPSWAVRLDGFGDDAAVALRSAAPVVVGRLAGGALWLDLRTVSDEDVEELAEAVARRLTPLR